MAVNPSSSFDKTFGAKKVAPARAPSQLWINIGYSTEEENKQGEKYFVSTPMGLAVDNQEKHKTNASDPTYARFMAAKNDLLDQIMAAGAKLAPGESMILPLEIQLRRVAEEVEVDNSNNSMIRKIL